MASRKRRRNTPSIACVFFPDDADSVVRGERAAASLSSTAKDWEKCGDSFTSASLLKNIKSSGKKLSEIRKLIQPSSTEQTSEDPQHDSITWSSDSSQSDSELRKQRGTSSTKKPRAPVQSHHRTLHCGITEKDDLPAIDTDSDVTRSEEEQISDCESEPPKGSSHDPATLQELDISPYESDGENVSDSVAWSRCGRAPAGEGSKRSVSDWVRSAHALLQTPQKSHEASCKTPEDSTKKRRKFQSGGLADRLNRLQRRHKSAISFWRHQSISLSPTGVDRPGVLVLKVLQCQEECGMQVVHCEQRAEEGHQRGDARSEDSAGVLVLFDKETAAQLRPAPGDVLHVHPPWQNLSRQGCGCDFILNTHFTQKVLCASQGVDHGRAEARPYSLCQTFGLLEVRSSSAGGDLQQVLAPEGRSGDEGLDSWSRHSASLLEVIERLGQAGSVGQDVVVTVQRVYCIPAPDCSSLSVLKSRLPSGPPAGTDQSRLCLLVQDSYGMFSVVQLHVLPSKDDVQRYCQVWQGKSCVLKGIKVVQRVTRERNTRLFTLLDSVWPPVMPPKCHGNTLTHLTPGPAPSFCYLLSGQESSVEPVQASADSPLYFPPKTRALRELLQIQAKAFRCSFTALVLYRRMQSDIGRGEVWLVLTDPSLQEDWSEAPCRRTVAMCVKTSCVLTSCVLEALNSASACRLSFRDALREHGVLLCAEQSMIERCEDVEVEGALDSAARMESGLQALSEALPRPVRLDPLGLEVSANSLCTLSGVIVGVEQSTAHSCPVCLHCGSDTSEWAARRPRSFICVSCHSVVDEPAPKLQLEVHLSCAQLESCAVKVKLLPRTMASVLDTLAPPQQLPGYDVQSLLGKEVGPLTALVRVVTRRPSLWIGLEEISLWGAGP
ncbi:DNA repair-scaffolding protein isoform X1 [Synchiropus splendidus]|uniref:DNA repair-scaffolding protein isoform X1 n=1 Tax=Synchiropus splendidus TaxID=270530 RepID=UPI00237E89B8|nr:DNA repair-scaffolding protein isoform X1 [Synchiropus splendidus]